ncbi:hypothetical protein [Colwellia hornerae]|uniref:Pentapeptide MXKDX repeat protein n=1 Tax=Colwellia hornerae TaxID=89402 RepID=A0A5C6QNX4_9GAMM|nr:hypothetical protein [Colwellia hornerae]TWX54635.1 hypothetical protein ESZ28_07955 [Colwellia hornerae]TWX61075.1 hypothetical protein ESZ26_06730 [Colwellia hornerae]TWX70328.1 hypothetical protein ESZ27_04220 [Colwellia hornerae]
MKTTLIKTISKIALVLIPTITLSMAATAHDPSMHVKKVKKADCSKMDHSKMDMNDPVTIAMMKKCMKQAKKANMEMDHSKMAKKMDHSKMDKKMEHSKMQKVDKIIKKKDEHDNH